MAGGWNEGIFDDRAGFVFGEVTVKLSADPPQEVSGWAQRVGAPEVWRAGIVPDGFTLGTEGIWIGTAVLQVSRASGTTSVPACRLYTEFKAGASVRSWTLDIPATSSDIPLRTEHTFLIPSVADSQVLGVKSYLVGTVPEVLTRPDVDYVLDLVRMCTVNPDRSVWPEPPEAP